MSGPISQLQNVQPGQIAVPRNRRGQARNGSLQMTSSTKPSGRPSPPVMRYLLFKAPAARWSRSATPTFMAAHTAG